MNLFVAPKKKWSRHYTAVQLCDETGPFKLTRSMLPKGERPWGCPWRKGVEAKNYPIVWVYLSNKSTDAGEKLYKVEVCPTEDSYRQNCGTWSPCVDWFWKTA